MGFIDERSRNSSENRDITDPGRPQPQKVVNTLLTSFFIVVNNKKSSEKKCLHVLDNWFEVEDGRGSAKWEILQVPDSAPTPFPMPLVATPHGPATAATAAHAASSP
jgi:hypothetical protein